MDIKKIITNWDTLTDQQKKEAENQVKKDPELNPPRTNFTPCC